ncbi:putative PAS/PAC sensor protein [Tepidanaerobacter acetatoxydans Re1]|uniref:Putative PAS/PAC sensor protein n=1 Tax=Tepidanaerobacter acetatoxydans (strain DSM 21804 / JCM 16047 / Re1) TaxID=1209989 RepID=F4LRQ5_TEPAE|nr:[Fe-Fe] hydrogenase large subunit C-terminal domain-containing protein [Tepidanaerobacter acetatoxydans]AEE91123.1 putative PAS/PAC sensor protein [Tepidanaerobacter acetatoxydans Re1]CDI40565.1 putative PAS/PAC sensor protein [Tepidanaerobacter acetatoxydans Re1]
MEVINFSRANCKNCYKCIRACPVKAIRMKDDQAEIVDERCITCGTCLTICPQNAKTVKSDVQRVKHLLKNDNDMAVSLAPSFAGIFSFQHYSQIVSALKKLGFSAVYQTSVGARLIAKDYLKHYNNRSKPNLITTACPAINYLIQKYYPELIECLVPVVSPMEAHGRYLKNIKGHKEVAFIGPCLAKKVEIHDEGNYGIDAVLTFEELMAWWEEEGIDPILESVNEVENGFCDDANFYPIPGGSYKTIEPFIQDKWREFIEVSGKENCIMMLDEIKKGEFHRTWIEMNACEGGCINGPAVGSINRGPFKRIKCVKIFARNNSSCAEPMMVEQTDIQLDFKKSYNPMPLEIKKPSEEEIKRILETTGKYRPEHELNCGVCGYNSCREKAEAVYNGMAEIHMCMPYMRNRAESLSNLIIESTPNAIIAVNMDMNVQVFNNGAEKMFKISSTDIIHKPLSLLFDDDDFKYVSKTKQNIINKKVYLPMYELITQQDIYYEKEHSLIIGIITDITAQQQIQERSIKLRKETVETAQQVIEKQMRVAQEIASVLGETTAETKVLLNKIQRLLIDEIPGE